MASDGQVQYSNKWRRTVVDLPSMTVVTVDWIVVSNEPDAEPVLVADAKEVGGGVVEDEVEGRDVVEDVGGGVVEVGVEEGVVVEETDVVGGVVVVSVVPEVVVVVLVGDVGGDVVVSDVVGWVVVVVVVSGGLEVVATDVVVLRTEMTE